jgi:hypothetical protein
VIPGPLLPSATPHYVERPVYACACCGWRGSSVSTRETKLPDLDEETGAPVRMWSAHCPECDAGVRLSFASAVRS